AAVDLCEGDQVSARRPYGRAVFAGAKADPLGAAPIGAHDIELLRPAAIRVEDDPAAVRSKARRGVDRLAVGQADRATGAQIERIQVAHAVLGAAEDHAVSVG